MSRQAADPSTGEPITEVFAQATISFERFPVPNYVRVKDIKVHEGESFQKIGAVPLSGVPLDVLDKLVNLMVEEIYAKAGRQASPKYVSEQGEKE